MPTACTVVHFKAELLPRELAAAIPDVQHGCVLPAVMLPVGAWIYGPCLPCLQCAFSNVAQHGWISGPGLLALPLACEGQCFM
jgi:hypothetical protein